MRDDDYNRLFGWHDPPNWIAWLIVAFAIVIVAFASVASANVSGCIDCTELRWVLHVDGHPIEVGSDLTQEECVDLAAQIDPGPPFTDIIKCVEEPIARTEL